MYASEIYEQFTEFEEEYNRILLPDNKWFEQSLATYTQVDIDKILAKLRKESIENPTKIIEFTVILSENPKAADRPQAKAVFSKKAGRVVPVLHSSTNDKVYRRQLRDEVERQFGEDFPIMEGDYVIFIDSYKAFLASFSKADELLAELGILRPLRKPDTDNVAKNIMDSLNGFLWLDDSQNTKLHMEKFYGKQSRLEVEIQYKQSRFNKKQ